MQHSGDVAPAASAIASLPFGPHLVVWGSKGFPEQFDDLQRSSGWAWRSIPGVHTPVDSPT